MRNPWAKNVTGKPPLFAKSITIAMASAALLMGIAFAQTPAPASDQATMPAPGGGFDDQMDDATLTANIRLALFGHDQLDGRDIQVTTRDAVVTLEGHVDSAADKSLAEAVAANTEGVRAVKNRLQVE